MKTIIHVNRHIIKANGKDGGNRPVLTVKNYKANRYAHEVAINGPSKLVYRPDNPLSCGAHVWIETHSEVILDPNGTPKSKYPANKRETASCPVRKQASQSRPRSKSSTVNPSLQSSSSM